MMPPVTAASLKDTATNKYNDGISTGSSDGKVSAIIPNLNVPVNDGTYRITIRWKTKMAPMSTASQTSSLPSSIYSLLNDLFSDDDGFLYHWGTEGLESYNSISNMTPQEVRSFISPSVTLMPLQSMMIIPIRFGFTSKTPSAWRNLETTKATLDKYNATVSFSNSKSTSGKLVIAGYILLKAPMTTHRLRYLQFLRSTLPDSTPGFDILLHRRTPVDQEINHLVIQCGEKHVHPISQVLIANLTGDRSPVYIPRFTFVDMTKEQVENSSKLMTSTSNLSKVYPYFQCSQTWILFAPNIKKMGKQSKDHFENGLSPSSRWMETHISNAM
jgi:hypothetical protein